MSQVQEEQSRYPCNRMEERVPEYMGLAAEVFPWDTAEVSVVEGGEAENDPVVVACGGDSEGDVS